MSKPETIALVILKADKPQISNNILSELKQTPCIDFSIVDKQTALVGMEGRVLAKHSIDKPRLVVLFSTNSTVFLNICVTLLQTVVICFCCAFMANLCWQKLGL